jgi:hypothetical protein
MPLPRPALSSSPTLVSLLAPGGRGVFLAPGNGAITFVPLGTTSVVPAIGYQVADANGTTSRSTLTVRTES